MRNYKAVAVSYLNTKPLLFGIYQEKLDEVMKITLANPAECANKLLSGEMDLGLVPVGILPELPAYHIVSDFCIGAETQVKTVCIFSDCPLDEIEELYLDNQSKTSVLLVQLLMKEYWNISPQLLAAADGFEQDIGFKKAALVIGDRAIPLLKKHRYVYDLAEAWYDWQQLPFVFAVWVSTRPLEASFIGSFNHALESGIQRIPALVQILPNPGFDFDLEAYFNDCISYRLDKAKMQSLKLFLTYLQSEKYRAVGQDSSI